MTSQVITRSENQYKFLGSLFKPQVFIYLLAFTLPFLGYIHIGSLPISIVYIFILIITILWVIRGLISSRWSFYFPREMLPMSLFLAIIILSFAWTNHLQNSLIRGVQIVAYYSIFLLAGTLLISERRIRWVIYMLICGAALSSLLGILQAAVGSLNPIPVVDIFYRGPLAKIILGSRTLQRIGDFGPTGPDILYRSRSIEGVGDIFRAFGMLEGPTIFGWFTATLAILMIGFYLIPVENDPGLSRKAGWGAFLGLVAVFLTWTRSAWLALVIGIAFIFAFRRAQNMSLLSKRWWWFGLLTTLLLGIILLIGYLTPDSSVGRMIVSAIGGPEASGSNAGRFQTALTAIDYLKDNPIKGIGFGNIGTLITTSGDVSDFSATFDTAHNTFLELGVELGLLGLLVFLWLQIEIFRGAILLIRQPNKTFLHALGVSLAGVWLTYLIIFMFGGNIVHPKWMTFWWLLAGLQAAARRVIRQSHQAFQSMG